MAQQRQGEAARAAASWLELRERADASARSHDLLRHALDRMPPGPSVVHDLGAGTGSMARWVAARLDRPQHWVLHDRDPDLLPRALAAPPQAAQGAEVTVEVRCHDVLTLPTTTFAGAGLITASALLDMLTHSELDALVALCVAAGSPVLIGLSVTGEVGLDPADPLDRHVRDAFNDHQRRRGPTGECLLGPDAVTEAVQRFEALGYDVQTTSTPWRLQAADAELLAEWFDGWVGAALEQRPELAVDLGDYLPSRRAALAEGRLRVTVGHKDLLALR